MYVENDAWLPKCKIFIMTGFIVCNTYKRLHEDKNIFDLNTEIQFLLRQGQVLAIHIML